MIEQPELYHKLWVGCVYNSVLHSVWPLYFTGPFCALVSSAKCDNESPSQAR